MRNMYNIPGIDLAAQRSSAIKYSQSFKSVIIHIHMYGETCIGSNHEHYYNGNQVEKEINDYVTSTEL